VLVLVEAVAQTLHLLGIGSFQSGDQGVKKKRDLRVVPIADDVPAAAVFERERSAFEPGAPKRRRVGRSYRPVA